MPFEVISGIGIAIAVFALILYIRDRIKVEPVILQTYVDKAAKPDEYIIRAFISNEGARKADNCEVAIEIGGNIIKHLDYVPIDSPKGRIGVDWPKYEKHTLYPRRPIWVRKYITAPNRQIALVLRRNGKEYDRLSFTLPKFD